jgi:Domain of unknown function (DUF4398)
MKPRTMTLILGGLAAACVVGCAESTPPPSDQWSVANEQIGRATATAPAVPDAKLHLQLAQEDLQKSKALIGTDNKRAATLILLATTEAQLATALASAAQAQQAAQQAQGALPSNGASPGASNLHAPNGPVTGVQAPSGK